MYKNQSIFLGISASVLPFLLILSRSSWMPFSILFILELTYHQPQIGAITIQDNPAFLKYLQNVLRSIISLYQKQYIICNIETFSLEDKMVLFENTQDGKTERWQGNIKLIMKRTVVHISKQFKTQENVLQQSSILFPFLESPILNSTAKKQIRFKKVYGIGNNKNIKSLVPHREPYHEFVFFGRSNVGKSTLLNQLLQQAVAAVSKQPGKTKELMFCELNTQYKAMMVDAPGYGFATGTSKKEINQWSKLITSYLKLTQPHKKHQQFMCLLDISHGVKESDALLFQLLKSFNKQFMLIFTKCDRMNDDDLHKAIEMGVNIQQRYQQMNFYIHFTSCLTMKGIDELRNHLMFSLVSQYL